jgi:hypothetical protein
MLLGPNRLEVIIEAYDRAGHRSIYATRGGISERFWRRTLEEDVKRFEDTCHECQTMSIEKIQLPLTISVPATVFANFKVPSARCAFQFPAVTNTSSRLVKGNRKDGGAIYSGVLAVEMRIHS